MKSITSRTRFTYKLYIVKTAFIQSKSTYASSFGNSMLGLRVHKRKPKIAFVVDFHDHTMGYMSNFLPEELSKLGFDVTLIVPEQSLRIFEKNELPCIDLKVENNCMIVRISENYKLIGLKNFQTKLGIGYFKFRNILKKEDFDVVQSFVISTGFINLQLFILKKFLNFKICLQDHTSQSVFFPSFKGKLYLKLFQTVLAPFYNKNTSCIFIPSPDIEHIVVEEYGLRQDLIKYEPLGVNTKWFHSPSSTEKLIAKNRLQDYGIPINSKVVIYAGKLTNKKGADFLAKAVGAVHKEDSTVYGLFVGTGDTIEIEDIERNLGCRVIPKQRASDLNYFYWAADLAVWPREGSTSILDAMACGLPTIVRSGLTETERKPFQELIFDEDNLDSLISVIIKMLKSENRDIFGQESSTRITQNYSWEKIALRRKDFYNTLLV